MKLAMTIREASESLSLGETTIRKMISLGQFPQPYRIGNAVRLRVSDILEWQEHLKTNPIEKKKMGRPRLAI